MIYLMNIVYLDLVLIENVLKNTFSHDLFDEYYCIMDYTFGSFFLIYLMNLSDEFFNGFVDLLTYRIRCSVIRYGYLVR